MLFLDRNDAARQLADELKSYRDKNPLVLAIPRGAVPMGKIIADALHGELDVVLVRKLRAPHQVELAVGSIAENGLTFIAPHAASVGATKEYLELEKARQLEIIRQQRKKYTHLRPPIDPRDRVVIVVDDGLATGATMLIALQAIRSRQPNKLICTIPVAATESLAQIKPYADEIIALYTPDTFYSVGQFYRHFTQVEDQEVTALLTDKNKTS